MATYRNEYATGYAWDNTHGTSSTIEVVESHFTQAELLWEKCGDYWLLLVFYVVVVLVFLYRTFWAPRSTGAPAQPHRVALAGTFQDLASTKTYHEVVKERARRRERRGTRRAHAFWLSSFVVTVVSLAYLVLVLRPGRDLVLQERSLESHLSRTTVGKDPRVLKGVAWILAQEKPDFGTDLGKVNQREQWNLINQNKLSDSIFRMEQARTEILNMVNRTIPETCKTVTGFTSETLEQLWTKFYQRPFDNDDYLSPAELPLPRVHEWSAGDSTTSETWIQDSWDEVYENLLSTISGLPLLLRALSPATFGTDPYGNPHVIALHWQDTYNVEATNSGHSPTEADFENTWLFGYWKLSKHVAKRQYLKRSTKNKSMLKGLSEHLGEEQATAMILYAKHAVLLREKVNGTIRDLQVGRERNSLSGTLLPCSVFWTRLCQREQVHEVIKLFQKISGQLCGEFEVEKAKIWSVPRRRQEPLYYFRVSEVKHLV